MQRARTGGVPPGVYDLYAATDHAELGGPNDAGIPRQIGTPPGAASRPAGSGGNKRLERLTWSEGQVW
jgi:hypothetical protein